MLLHTLANTLAQTAPAEKLTLASLAAIVGGAVASGVIKWLTSVSPSADHFFSNKRRRRADSTPQLGGRFGTPNNPIHIHAITHKPDPETEQRLDALEEFAQEAKGEFESINQKLDAIDTTIGFVAKAVGARTLGDKP